MNIRMAAEFDGKSIQTDSIVDGPGLRAVIWTQGCAHNCKGCHNPGTHDFNCGIDTDVDKICKELSELRYHTGVTFSGGDPMYQSEACSKIAAYAKKIGLNVWCYTGFTFEELVKLSEKNSHISEFLNNIDILVDGRFVLEKRNLDLLFRGSENQRLIDMRKTLESGKIILLNEYEYTESAQFEKAVMYI